jgi:hypothetical protein
MIAVINSFWRSVIHPHASVRARRRLAHLAAAVVAIAAAAVSALAPMPPASSLPGRRICQYVWQQNLGKQYVGPQDKSPENRMVSFVINYKKDGACPHVDPHKIVLPSEVGQWMPFPDAWLPEPVPKMTCEEFQNRLQLPSDSDGGDPCVYMTADELYAVTGPLDSDHGPTPLGKRRIWQLGSIWNLQ